MRYESPKNLKEAIREANSIRELLEETQGKIKCFLKGNIGRDDRCFWVTIEGINDEERILISKKQLKNMFDERIKQLEEEYENSEKIVKMYCECKNKEEVEAVYVKLEKEHWGIKG